MEEALKKLKNKEYDKLTIGEVFVLGLVGQNIDGYIKYKKEQESTIAPAKPVVYKLK